MPERLTDAELEALERLENVATKGEWVAKRCGSTSEIWSDRGQIADLQLWPMGSVATDANGNLIAAMRNALPRLLEEIREGRRNAKA